MNPMALSRRSFLAGAPAAAARNAERVAGAWVLQQVSGLEELERLLPRVIAPALATPHLRGFCLRAAWKAIDRDFALLDAGFDIARTRGVAFSVRFMAGRHTPARVFEAGSPFYLRAGEEKVPLPFQMDGAPNAVFEAEYRAFVSRLAAWCRGHAVPLLHLAWYGQDWAELNHGLDVRRTRGYTFPHWRDAHLRLIDIALETAGPDLATELPFSGHGPLTDAAQVFADHVVARIGPSNPLFFCQANGWGPQGEWGAPSEATEAAFRRVWAKPICRGLQMIQPFDYDWAAVFRRLYDVGATYGEVYAPSFSLAHKAQLADQIRQFAQRAA